MKILKTVTSAIAATCLISGTSFAEVDYYKGKSHGETCKVRIYKDFDDNITKIKVKGMANLTVAGKYKYKKEWDVLLKADDLTAQSTKRRLGVIWQKNSKFTSVSHSTKIQLMVHKNSSKLKSVKASEIWGMGSLKSLRSLECTNLDAVTYDLNF